MNSASVLFHLYIILIYGANKQIYMLNIFN
jgi:hypothetical protein